MRAALRKTVNATPVLRGLVDGSRAFLRAFEKPQVAGGNDRVENANVSVEIGLFTIEIPSTSPLGRHYKEHPFTQRFLIHLIKSVHKQFPDLIAVDAGANVGDTLALIKTAADIPVICVEGDPVCAATLERNARQFTNTTIVKQYLNENDGTASMVIDKVDWNSTLVFDETGGGKAVTFTTLDSLLVSHPNSHNIHVIKVDCEGFDFRVLRGARSFMARQKPVLQFELNYFNLSVLKEDGKTFLHWLVSLGYKRFFVFESLGDFLFECPATCLDPLDGIIDYVRTADNRLAYLDIVAFCDGMEFAVESFREMVNKDVRDRPIAGIDRKL
jgi:FkbM family methyltransferase